MIRYCERFGFFLKMAPLLHLSSSLIFKRVESYGQQIQKNFDAQDEERSHFYTKFATKHAFIGNKNS